MDLAGVEKARQFDLKLVSEGLKLAEYNELNSEIHRDLLKQAAAAGERCRKRAEMDRDRVSAAALNDAIYHTAHQGIGVACQRIRGQIAKMFPHAPADVLESSPGSEATTAAIAGAA